MCIILFPNFFFFLFTFAHNEQIYRPKLIQNIVIASIKVTLEKCYDHIMLFFLNLSIRSAILTLSFLLRLFRLSQFDHSTFRLNLLQFLLNFSRFVREKKNGRKTIRQMTKKKPQNGQKIFIYLQRLFNNSTLFIVDQCASVNFPPNFYTLFPTFHIQKVRWEENLVDWFSVPMAYFKMVLVRHFVLFLFFSLFFRFVFIIEVVALA